MCLHRRSRGFTLIELLIALTIIGILSAIAVPAYTMYVQRSKVPVGLDALSAYATRMEQRYQDNGSYANGAACGVALPNPAPDNFTMACAIGGGGQTFTATATGSGPVNGYAYSIDSSGVRRTTAHPKGLPATNCWTTRGNTCDT